MKMGVLPIKKASSQAGLFNVFVLVLFD